MLLSYLRLTLLAGLALAVAAPLPGAQTVSFASLTGDGSRELRTLDALGGVPLQTRVGLSFLDPQLNGRLRADRLRFDLPNLIDVGGPAPGLRLPERGTLYFVEQTARRELLLIDGLGLPITLLDDVAAAGQIAAAMAVDDTGTQVLLATDTGRLWLVDTLASVPPRELTPISGPVSSLSPTSLRLGQGFAWMVAAGRVFRVDHSLPAARFEQLVHALDPGEVIASELVMSKDGKTVGGVSRLPGGLRHLYIAHETGALRRLSAIPADIDLPSLGNPGGPLLAVAPDGSCIAWRQSVIVKELFMRRLDIPATPKQLTADSQFADTFDSGTIFDFIAGGQLVFLVGESALLDPETSLGSAEFYRVDPNAPGSPISNLSQTSGQLSTPFLAPGELEIKDLVRSPGGERVLIHVDPDGGDHLLLALDLAQPGALLPLTSPSDVAPRLVGAGSSLLLVEPAVGPAAGRLIQLRAGLPDVELSAIPVGVTLDRFTTNRSGQTTAFVGSFGPGQELPVYADLVANRLRLVWPLVAPLSEGLAFTRDGRLALGVGNVPKHGLIAPGVAPLLAQIPAGPAVPLAP